MKIDLDNQSGVDYLKTLCEQEGVSISLVWQSKYNRDVAYDYEPFCSDGFQIIADITGEPRKLEFVKYLYNKMLKELDFVERCYSL